MLPKFDPKQTKFTIENAYVLMRASQATYSSDYDTYYGRLLELGITQDCQVWIQGQFDACFLGWTDDWMILSFRGTDNPGGWVSNLYGAVPVSRPQDYYGKIHPGFADGLNSLWNDLHAKLTTDPLKDKPLFITGHSRGGALATLAAQSLVYVGIKPVAVYTYGSPRAGNSTFADKYDVPCHYRVENDRDIVPHVPPAPAFAHVGERHWLNAEGEFEEPTDEETPTSPVVTAALTTFATGALGRIGTPILGGVVSQGLLANEFFSDHANTEYAYWLWKLLAQADHDDAATSHYP
ncbi:MAG: lipase family protein [Planctomycetes bacterium]|jgi:hypothetical protein|nr:lipase family protein [Planctomycetota bacterium]